ncbi:serine protease snk [Cochliomyia hominivorax]
MYLFKLLLLLIISILNLVQTQNIFYDNTNLRPNRPNNNKVYFPGETNANEVNMKRINKAIAQTLITETNTNHIDYEVDGRPLASAASGSSILNTLREVLAPARRTSSSNINSLNSVNSYNNSSSSSVKKVMERKRNSSEVSNESKDSKLNSSEETKRPSATSILASTLVSALSRLRVCEIKYAEYIKRIFPKESDTAKDANDDEFNGRVLAAPGEYPHMTALGFRSKNGKVDYKCGGSLISENFVITAAHCTNLTGLQPDKVRIGDLNLMIEESYLEPQIRDIRKIYVHPDYRSNSYYNDIALLELTQEVVLTEFVRPIRLWTHDTIPFTTAYAMGYGATDFARKRTNRLTNLNMTIVSNSDCDREMPKIPETDRGIISSQICARDYQLNRDTCQGDSGGPLQLNIRGRRSQNRLHYQLIGITSYGLYCRSGYPSIFTRVYSYLDWIERIVWRDYFD